MRTNIDIDDQLMAEALAASGVKTKREVVEMALELLAGRKRRIEALDRLWGLDPYWGEFSEARAAE